MNLDEFTKALNSAFNQVASEDGLKTTRRTNSYRYYRSTNPTNKSRALDRYFWTIPKNWHSGKDQYISGVYRYNATTETWKARLIVGHSKRKDAKSRANKLMNEAK